MKFRQHRGSLADSMDTLTLLPDRAALIVHCRWLLAPFNVSFRDDQLSIVAYSADPRIGWDPQSVVLIDGYGLIGMTDTPPDA